jgi:leucyl/phenylalanyl-tRNA---protein transferase
MQKRRKPIWIREGSPPEFPSPELADGEGLVAIGGDLTPERLMAAYDAGIFPWYDAGLPPLWWSPDPRAVLDRAALHISRSMRREFRRSRWELSYNRCFSRVMTECGAERRGGTWILPEMVRAYDTLNRQGVAHSVEVWEKNDLVGGMYGVQRGALFAAESMFHRRTNASKFCLIACALEFFKNGVELFDVQFLTEHLASLGAHSVSRANYLARLGALREKQVSLTRLFSGSALARVHSLLTEASGDVSPDEQRAPRSRA